MLDKVPSEALSRISSFLVGGHAILQRINRVMQCRTGYKIIPLPYEYTLESVECMRYFKTPLMSWGNSVPEFTYLIDLCFFDALLFRVSFRQLSEESTNQILRDVNHKSVHKLLHPLVQLATYYSGNLRDTIATCVQFSDIHALYTASSLCGLDYILKLAVIVNNWVVIDWVWSQSVDMPRFYVTVAMQAAVCGNRPIFHWCVQAIDSDSMDLSQFARAAVDAGQTTILQYLLSQNHIEVIKDALLSTNINSLRWAMDLGHIATHAELVEYHTNEKHVDVVKWLTNVSDYQREY